MYLFCYRCTYQVFIYKTVWLNQGCQQFQEMAIPEIGFSIICVFLTCRQHRQNCRIHPLFFLWHIGITLRLKKIRPFAVFSYKFVIFAWSKMGVKVIENSPFLQKMLKYVRYHSSRDLEPKFSVLQKIRAFKVRSIQFHLIKCQFFGSFNFEGLYF